MRINRGLFKTRRFSPPKGFPSRPTTDYAKEGIFNMMENRMSLFDLDILDLCAGTGNISIEFLSREAGFVTSVDKHPVCIKYMYKLKNELGIEDTWQISKNDVRIFLKKTPDTYDIIFADPPYDLSFHADLVTTIRERSLLNPGGWCIIEHGRQTNLSQEQGYLETRNFGNVYFSFFQFES